MSMKLENQVISFELAQKLKELGVQNESQFRWWKGIGSQYLMPTDWSQFNMEPKPSYDTADVREYFPAYTVAELGEILPYWLPIKKRVRTQEWFFVSYKLTLGWFLKYENGSQSLYGVTDKSEANARAKMLIYLLENKLV